MDLYGDWLRDTRAHPSRALTVGPASADNSNGTLAAGDTGHRKDSATFSLLPLQHSVLPGNCVLDSRSALWDGSCQVTLRRVGIILVQPGGVLRPGAIQKVLILRTRSHI